jgi:CRISP-associated protein Cas1
LQVGKNNKDWLSLVYSKPAAAKMLVARISLNLNRRAKYKGKNYSYQSMLLDNVQQLANFIAGRKHELEFVVPLVKIDRNDSIDVREMILNMTPSQRKMLGINKSTLWYQKRNLREGKSIKLYNKSKTGVLQDKPTVAKMQWLQRGHGDILPPN